MACGVVTVFGRPDARIAQIATAQFGVVSRRQLLTAGISDARIQGRVRRGILLPRGRGVYAVAWVDASRQASCVRGLLATREGAVLSHLTAGELLRLGTPVADTAVHVLVACSTATLRPGIVVHRTRTRGRPRPFFVNGLPVTQPAQTIVDLAGVVSGRELERAVDEALARRLASPASIDRLATEQAARPGVRNLRHLLDGRVRATVTRSEAEERLLALLRAAGLREPRCNVRLHGFIADFFWPQARLVVEVDGYQWHSTRSAFERDRRKDAVLRAHGIEIVRVTWDAMTDRPLETIASIAGLCGARHTPSEAR